MTTLSPSRPAARTPAFVIDTLARAMIALVAQDRVVTRDALLTATDLTGGEIDRYGVEAADRAKHLQRAW